MTLLPDPNLIADQKAFQLQYGHGVLPFPQIPSEAIQERRRMIVEEEFNKEFLGAWEACNNLSRLPKDEPARKELEVDALAELGDAIADSIYVLIGTAFEYGIPLAAIWKAVQEANMSKLWSLDEMYARANEVGFTVTTDSYNLKDGWKFKRTAPGAQWFIAYDQFGKVKKPPSWKEPDIKGIIRNAINKAQTPPDQQARREEWVEAIAKAEQAEPGPDKYVRKG